jgi:predicted GNAT superfamily acetyltransferase
LETSDDQKTIPSPEVESVMKKQSPVWNIRILENPEEMNEAEELQRVVWPGSETDIVPLHVLITVAHNGGIVIGAYSDGQRSLGAEIEDPASEQESLIGFVYGFPGLYFTPDGPRPKHCSQQLAVHPDYQNQGLGFFLKRAQWQMVRHQGLDLITWTFDPLLSRNAHLNISRLGAVCSTYLREVYGEMRDGLNAGLPSDRFQVDWWVNTRRVNRRLSKKARSRLDLAHFLSAGAEIVNPSHLEDSGYPKPSVAKLPPPSGASGATVPLLLVEIPSDINAIRAVDMDLALEWRMSIRNIFEELFGRGYLVTDFIHMPATPSRSFYVLSHGESTL